MYTGTYLNPDNSSFYEKVNSEIYVDKTNLIKFTNRNICSSSKFICSTRPRRFGKSMAIDMLKAYYSKGCDSKELFKGLNVENYDINNKKESILSEKYEKNMNAYDVIYFDMQTVLTKVSYSIEAVQWLKDQIIEELKEVYPDCIKEKYDLASTLMEINRVTKKQFVILIDEWDALFRFDKENIKAQEKYMVFLRSLFKGAEADNFVALAYITGILPIKKYGQESALNNFDEYTMVQPKKMVEYIGFTEEEVKSLCEEHDMNFDKMKEWYDGYKLKGIHIYSPNSVCKALQNEEMLNYWVSTDTYETLKIYISFNFEGLKDDIIDMLAGGRCNADVDFFKNDLLSFTSKDDILACLVHLGYLAYDANSKKVYIPNKEVKNVFEKAIKEANWTEVIKAIQASEKLLKNTLNKNSEEVAKAIGYAHLESDMQI